MAPIVVADCPLWSARVEHQSGASHFTSQPHHCDSHSTHHPNHATHLTTGKSACVERAHQTRTSPHTSFHFSSASPPSPPQATRSSSPSPSTGSVSLSPVPISYSSLATTTTSSPTVPNRARAPARTSKSTLTTTIATASPSAIMAERLQRPDGKHQREHNLQSGRCAPQAPPPPPPQLPTALLQKSLLLRFPPTSPPPRVGSSVGDSHKMDTLSTNQGGRSNVEDQTVFPRLSLHRQHNRRERHQSKCVENYVNRTHEFKCQSKTPTTAISSVGICRAPKPDVGGGCTSQPSSQNERPAFPIVAVQNSETSAVRVVAKVTSPFAVNSGDSTSTSQETNARVSMLGCTTGDRDKQTQFALRRERTSLDPCELSKNNLLTSLTNAHHQQLHHLPCVVPNVDTTSLSTSFTHSFTGVQHPTVKTEPNTDVPIESFCLDSNLSDSSPSLYEPLVEYRQPKSTNQSICGVDLAEQLLGVQKRQLLLNRRSLPGSTLASSSCHSPLKELRDKLLQIQRHRSITTKSSHIGKKRSWNLAASLRTTSYRQYRAFRNRCRSSLSVPGNFPSSPSSTLSSHHRPQPHQAPHSSSTNFFHFRRPASEPIDECEHRASPSPSSHHVPYSVTSSLTTLLPPNNSCCESHSEQNPLLFDPLNHHHHHRNSLCQSLLDWPHQSESLTNSSLRPSTSLPGGLHHHHFHHSHKERSDTGTNTCLSTIMEILPLLLLLTMGVIISTTCAKYTFHQQSPVKALPGAISVDGSQPSAYHRHFTSEHVEHSKDNSKDSLKSAQENMPAYMMMMQGDDELSQTHDGGVAMESTENHRVANAGELKASNLHRSYSLQDQQNYQHQQHLLAQLAHQYSAMRLRWLSNSSVTCNDGTRAGYYVRHSPNSRRWLIYLEGGWYCMSKQSCDQRWTKLRQFMTSIRWTQYRAFTGILSTSKATNPHWHDANHVFIPYCSSDIWSGDSSSSPNEYAFQGSRIIEEVIKELQKNVAYQFKEANFVLLAGSSAGAAGVMINLDRVSKMIHDSGSRADVRGLADSGWILENYFLENFQQPIASSPDCTDCSTMEGIRGAYNLWNSRVPEACAEHYPNEPWRCYFGYRLYPTLKTPLYIIQFQYDEYQIHVDGIARRAMNEQDYMQYIRSLSETMRSSLANASAVFAPSCMAHIILNKPEWHKVSVKGVTLPDALNCWEKNSQFAHRGSRRAIDSYSSYQQYRRGSNHHQQHPHHLSHQQQQQQNKFFNFQGKKKNFHPISVPIVQSGSGGSILHAVEVDATSGSDEESRDDELSQFYSNSRSLSHFTYGANGKKTFGNIEDMMLRDSSTTIAVVGDANVRTTKREINQTKIELEKLPSEENNNAISLESSLNVTPSPLSVTQSPPTISTSTPTSFSASTLSSSPATVHKSKHDKRKKKRKRRKNLNRRLHHQQRQQEHNQSNQSHISGSTNPMGVLKPVRNFNPSNEDNQIRQNLMYQNDATIVGSNNNSGNGANRQKQRPHRRPSMGVFDHWYNHPPTANNDGKCQFRLIDDDTYPRISRHDCPRFYKSR